MTPYTNPENSWTKRFAKKEAQLDPGTGYDPVYPPRSEMGPVSDELEDDQALEMIYKLIPYAQSKFGEGTVNALQNMRDMIQDVMNMDKEDPAEEDSDSGWNSSGRDQGMPENPVSGN